jgi:hypothetical protein
LAAPLIGQIACSQADRKTRTLQTILSKALEKSWTIEESRGAIIILEVRCGACYTWLPEAITWEIFESTTTMWRLRFELLN